MANNQICEKILTEIKKNLYIGIDVCAYQTFLNVTVNFRNWQLLEIYHDITFVIGPTFNNICNRIYLKPAMSLAPKTHFKRIYQVSTLAKMAYSR